MSCSTPYRDGRLFVGSALCDTCVFAKGNRMDLEPGRLRSLIDQNLDNGSALTCHRTIYEDPKHRHAICRGFYDRFKDASPALRLAQIARVIEFIDPPPKEGTMCTNPTPPPSNASSTESGYGGTLQRSTRTRYRPVRTRSDPNPEENE
jgi:hypothetical protein